MRATISALAGMGRTQREVTPMKRSTKLWTAGVLVAGLAAAGCGKGGKDGDKPSPDHKAGPAAGESPPMSAEEQAAAMQKAAEETKKSFKEMNGGKDIKAVDAKDLKAMLPAELAGAKRGSVESQHTNTMGMDMTTADADYETAAAANDDGSHPKPGFHVQIMDFGNASSSVAMGYSAWALTDYERETDTGYEKTVKYKGCPGQETYDREAKSGSMHVLVAKRFVVEVNGHDATIEQIRAALDALDVSRLEALVK